MRTAAPGFSANGQQNPPTNSSGAEWTLHTPVLATVWSRCWPYIVPLLTLEEYEVWVQTPVGRGPIGPNVRCRDQGVLTRSMNGKCFRYDATKWDTSAARTARGSHSGSYPGSRTVLQKDVFLELNERSKPIELSPSEEIFFPAAGSVHRVMRCIERMTGEGNAVCRPWEPGPAIDHTKSADAVPFENRARGLSGCCIHGFRVGPIVLWKTRETLRQPREHPSISI